MKLKVLQKIVPQKGGGGARHASKSSFICWWRCYYGLKELYKNKED